MRFIVLVIQAKLFHLCVESWTAYAKPFVAQWIFFHLANTFTTVATVNQKHETKARL